MPDGLIKSEDTNSKRAELPGKVCSGMSEKLSDKKRKNRCLKNRALKNHQI